MVSVKGECDIIKYGGEVLTGEGVLMWVFPIIVSVQSVVFFYLKKRKWRVTKPCALDAVLL